jgi:hypothetical protein
MLVGLSWTAVGFIYLLYVTHFFALPVPEMAFEEAD